MKHLRWCNTIVFMVMVVAISIGGAGSCAFGEVYVSGAEGIEGATVPPPGLHIRNYNMLITDNVVKDGNGNSVPVIDPHFVIYANVTRALYVSNFKLLGADVGAGIALPFLYPNMKMRGIGYSDDQPQFGDIQVDPFILAWHGSRYDATIGIGFFAPTGLGNHTKTVNLGSDCWTGMLTVGGTLYLDEARTWSASILSRYEMHSDRQDIDLRNGDDFHFEWGLGKTLPVNWFGGIWKVGASGYAQWQVTGDSGNSYLNTGVTDRVFAAGPEIDFLYPLPPDSCFAPLKAFGVWLRSQWEFGAVDRPRGNRTTLVLGFSF